MGEWGRKRGNEGEKERGTQRGGGSAERSKRTLLRDSEEDYGELSERECAARETKDR